MDKNLEEARTLFEKYRKLADGEYKSLAGAQLLAEELHACIEEMYALGYTIAVFVKAAPHIRAEAEGSLTVVELHQELWLIPIPSEGAPAEKQPRLDYAIAVTCILGPKLQNNTEGAP